MEMLFVIGICFLYHIAAGVNGSMSTTPGPQVVKTKENEQLLITAVPQDINQLNTEPLTINCTYQPPPSQSQFVVQSLVLTKSDGFVLSSLHVTNPDVPTTPDASLIRPGHVSIKGHLRSTGSLTSYLSLTWYAPTEKEQGTYHCEAIIKEEQFSALHIYRETNVHDNTNLFIKNKIESLDKALANQKEDTSYCRQKMENYKEMLLNKSLVCLKKYNLVEAELKFQNKASSDIQIDIKSLKKEIGDQRKNYVVCKEKTYSLEKMVQQQKSMYSQKLKSVETELDNQKNLVSGYKTAIASLHTEIARQKTSISAHEKRLVQLEKYSKLVHDHWTSFFVSTVFKNRAYLLSKEITDGFSNAEPACGSMGGYLAEIDDEEEWSFIVAFIKEKKIGFTLIGGKDDIKEGSWYWSHSKRPVSFSDWRSGEPNNGQGHGDEDCLEIYNNFKYNDIPCKVPNRYHFICEIPLFDYN